MTYPNESKQSAYWQIPLYWALSFIGLIVYNIILFSVLKGTSESLSGLWSWYMSANFLIQIIFFSTFLGILGLVFYLSIYALLFSVPLIVILAIPFELRFIANVLMSLGIAMLIISSKEKK